MEDGTWEPEENLTNSDEILHDFLVQNNLLPTLPKPFKNDVLNNEGNETRASNELNQIFNTVKTEAINEEHISVADDFIKTKEVC